MPRRGSLVLVVGPSGAGKDSIIAGAAERLNGDGRFVFARRVITRPADAGGENHLPVSPAVFAELRDGGDFLLHWQAHGLAYGLSAELAADLAAGRTIIANVSRTVIADARQRWAPVIVVAVSASAATLAARLAQRGREDSAGVQSRLRRAASVPVEADVVIDNDGPLQSAVDRLVAVLRARLPQPASL